MFDKTNTSTTHPAVILFSMWQIYWHLPWNCWRKVGILAKNIETNKPWKYKKLVANDTRKQNGYSLTDSLWDFYFQALLFWKCTRVSDKSWRFINNVAEWLSVGARALYVVFLCSCQPVCPFLTSLCPLPCLFIFNMSTHFFAQQLFGLLVQRGLNRPSGSLPYGATLCYGDAFESRLGFKSTFKGPILHSSSSVCVLSRYYVSRFWTCLLQHTPAKSTVKIHSMALCKTATVEICATYCRSQLIVIIIIIMQFRNCIHDQLVLY